MTRKVLAIVTAGLAAAGIAAATQAATPSGAGPEAINQADALIGAAPADSAKYAPAAIRNAANVRGAAVPLPAGGTFNGVRWELAGGDVGAGTILGVLQYNAACQWLRAWRDGRDAALASTVLQQIPSWTVFRGTESGAFLSSVAAEMTTGGGADVTGMLRDCDASHTREVAYAKQLGLTPSS